MEYTQAELDRFSAEERVLWLDDTFFPHGRLREARRLIKSIARIMARDELIHNNDLHFVHIMDEMSYLLDAVEELETMKVVRFFQTVSVYDVFTGATGVYMMKLLRTKGSVSSFRSCEYREVYFPIFLHDLDMTMNEHNYNLVQYEFMKDELYQIFDGRFPGEVLDAILSNLSMSDILNFVYYTKP